MLELDESAERSQRVADVGPTFRVVAIGERIPYVGLAGSCQGEHAKNIGRARVTFLNHQPARPLVEKAPTCFAGALLSIRVEGGCHHALMLLMTFFIPSLIEPCMLEALLMIWLRV